MERRRTNRTHPNTAHPRSDHRRIPAAAARTPRRSATVAALTAAFVLAALTIVALPASADPLPLSTTPTVDLTCDSGTSTLTIHWPVGEYGIWRLGDEVLGDVTGPGGVFTTATDEVHVVPSGWTATSSTFRLNLDTGPLSDYNQTHVQPNGASCPFTTTIAFSMHCPTHTLSINVASGHVGSYVIYDDATGTIIDERVYPEYSEDSIEPIPMPVGPVALPVSIPRRVTRVRAELVIDNTSFTASTSVRTRRSPSIAAAIGPNAGC